jgi:hypothetical protein
MERPVFAAQFVFDDALRCKLAAPQKRRVFEQLRPGERSDNAETFLEAAFDLAQSGVVLVLAGGVVLGDSAKERVRIQKLVLGLTPAR